VRDGRLRTNIGTVSTLDDAVAAFNSTERRPGKTIIRVHPEDSGMQTELRAQPREAVRESEPVV